MVSVTDTERKGRLGFPTNLWKRKWYKNNDEKKKKKQNRLFNLKVTESSLTLTPREYTYPEKIDALIPNSSHLSFHDLFPFYSPFA